MRPTYLTLSAAGASAPVPTDHKQAPFEVSLAVVLSAGATLTYDFQYTYDDVWAKTYNPATGTWITPAGGSAKTATADLVIKQPVMAVRVNITAYTGGTASVVVLQSGDKG